MMYTVIRDKTWTIDLERYRSGYHYRAWPGWPEAAIRRSAPVDGWTLGVVRDGLDSAIQAIDDIQGQPSYCELPRKVKEVSRG